MPLHLQIKLENGSKSIDFYCDGFQTVVAVIIVPREHFNHITTLKNYLEVTLKTCNDISYTLTSNNC